MKFNIWSNPDETEIACVPHNKPHYGCAILLHSYDATTWLEAMQEYYKYMDFGEFKPSMYDGKIDPMYMESLDVP